MTRTQEEILAFYYLNVIIDKLAYPHCVIPAEFVLVKTGACPREDGDWESRP